MGNGRSTAEIGIFFSSEERSATEIVDFYAREVLPHFT